MSMHFFPPLITEFCQSMWPVAVDVQPVYPTDEEPKHVQPHQPTVVRVQCVYITDRSLYMSNLTSLQPNLLTTSPLISK